VSLSNARRSSRRIGRRLAARARRAASGFTLLEALIAIVVLALSLSALMPSHNAGLRSLVTVDDHLRARLLAQSVMAEWSHNRALRPGTIEGGYDKFAWTLSIAPLEAPAAQGAPANAWTLYELVLRVSWPRGRQIELHTARMGRAQ
jgi:general secretion pathway protein I